MPMSKYSQKQRQYLNENVRYNTHRWGFKVGATRSGKSWIDIAEVIPRRIISGKGKPGLNFIIGVSKSTIERNVLEPMREIFGSKRISDINSQNIATLFGEKVYCLGAEKISQVAKFRGASAKYIYGDEVAEWNEEVFTLLKSRLDKPYSCFDGSLNPEFPGHWLETFISSDADIYLQNYTIFDNPFLPAEFVENLCKEYEGTIYYNRYILGQWIRAEGAIYKKFANSPKVYLTEVSDELIDSLREITIGIDFGGTKSGHSFVATAHTPNYRKLVALASERHTGDYDPNQLEKEIMRFAQFVQDKYGLISYCYFDNAEPVLGRGVERAFDKADKFRHCVVRGARKEHINDRINCELRLIGANRFIYTPDCETLKDALCTAVWNDKKLNDERLDNGTSDIDTLDAFEYTFERDMKTYVDR